MSPSQLGAFARSGPDVATADLEYHVQPLSLDAFGEPLHDFPAITASVCHLRPESRGHVRITSSDPKAHPAIQPNYLSTDRDREVAVSAIRLTRRIMGGAGHLSNDQALDAIVRLDRAARLAGVVLLHLSRDCNDPSLVQRLYARRAPHLANRLTISRQDRPTGMLEIAPRSRSSARTRFCSARLRSVTSRLVTAILSPMRTTCWRTQDVPPLDSSMQISSSIGVPDSSTAR